MSNRLLCCDAFVVFAGSIAGGVALIVLENHNKKLRNLGISMVVIPCAAGLSIALGKVR